MHRVRISRREMLQSSAAIGCIATTPRSLTAAAAPMPASAPAVEYFTHFAALSSLSVAVADAMPTDKYSFRPHPESMTFAELMSHIATTNFQFGAGLKDSSMPALPSPADKPATVKFLRDSFDYCSAIISALTDGQLSSAHDSPDGRLLGREILLAMYVHVAHHRGQAEIYLRDNGLRPPSYRV